MYKAKNGFMLNDNTTKWGWPIKTARDIATALQWYGAFATVETEFLLEAFASACEERLVYDDIEAFGNFLLANYI